MTLDQSAQGAETAPDHDEIVQFIETGYINAFHEADYSKMRRFFHPDSWYFFTTRDGTLYKGPFNDDEVRGWAGSNQDWEHTILSVTQAGDVASVVLEMHSKSDPGSAWVDVHALLRIDGEWYDMNKTATHDEPGRLGGQVGQGRSDHRGLPPAVAAAERGAAQGASVAVTSLAQPARLLWVAVLFMSFHTPSIRRSEWTSTQAFGGVVG